MTIAGMVGSRTPLSDAAIISDMEAPKDRIERALCLFVFMISPFRSLFILIKFVECGDFILETNRRNIFGNDSECAFKVFSFQLLV